MVWHFLAELLKRHTPTRSLRSSDQLLLTVPRSRSKLRGDRVFSVVAPRLWNSLPLYVRAAPTIFTFITRFKINVLSQAFNSTGYWRVPLTLEFIFVCSCFCLFYHVCTAPWAAVVVLTQQGTKQAHNVIRRWY